MSVWKCPVCGSFMQHRGRCWSCTKGHSFDMAKSGYVNLLPANRKHAKNPGDNAVMMRARKKFLDAGHYAPLLQALEKAAEPAVFCWMPAVGKDIIPKEFLRHWNRPVCPWKPMAWIFPRVRQMLQQSAAQVPILQWEACTICRWQTNAVIC